MALDAVNIEHQVAILNNGIYISREATSGTNLFDIDRIEVLPNPQGTLYGRSATGGVVSTVYKRPGNDFGGHVLAEYGDFDYQHVMAAVNLPASDSAKFRFAVNYNKENGYYTSGSGADHDLGVRLSALLDPVDNLTIYLWGSYIQHRGTTINGVNFPYLYPGVLTTTYSRHICNPSDRSVLVRNTRMTTLPVGQSTTPCPVQR